MSSRNRVDHWAIGVLGAAAASLAVCMTACTGSSGPTNSASPSGSAGGSSTIATSGSTAHSGSTPPSGSAEPRSTSAPPSRSGSPKQTSSPTATALSTVPTVPVTTLPAKPLTSSARFGTGVLVRIGSITHGKVTDTGRGAIRGRPTVVFHFVLTNDSLSKVNVSDVQVNATYGASDTPAVQADNTSTPFSGSVAHGANARGVYAFAVPPSGQSRVEVTVTYQQGVPTVLLRGSAR